MAAFLVGLPALRLRGLYLAVTTLAFAVAVQSWLLDDGSFHWFPRRDERLERPALFGRISLDSATAYYWYVVVVALVVFAAVLGIRRSRSGRVIMAVRDNERAAQAFSVSAVRAKLTAFTISGAIAGVAGGLFVHLNQAFNLDSYGPGQSLDVFVAAVIGGLGTIAGAVLGALFLRGTQWFITAPEWRFLSSGAGVLLVLLVLPGGLASLFVKLRDVGVRWLQRRSVASVAHARSPTAAVAEPTDGRRREHVARASDWRSASLAPSRPSAWTPSAVSRFLECLRHPMAWLREVCGGQWAFPLVVLFGLNAVDELDRTAFGILLPEIQESFGLDLSAVLGLVALSSVGALLLQVPIAQFADRHKRVPLAIGGALVWACFSGMTGLATTLVVLTIARSGSSIGKAVNDPTHNSLLADYYPIEARHRVFSVHRAANAVGSFVGPLVAGFLAFWFGWRVPFLVFVVPTVIFAVLALRLHEPVRGSWERRAAGASDEVADTAELPPSFAESWRIVHKVPTLRRLWYSLPFVAVSLVGFVVLASLLYEQEFGLDERARGVAAAIAEPFQLVGLVYGARIVARRFAGNVAGMMRFLSTLCLVAAVASVGLRVRPEHRRRRGPELRHLGDAGGVHARPARHALAGDPCPRPGHRVLDRLAVGDPRVARAADRRWHRRRLHDPRRHVRDAAPVRHRRARSSAAPSSTIERDIAQVWEATAARERGAAPTPPGRRRAAPRAQARRRLRRPPGAVRRRHRRPRGRDRRPARHERRRQEHAAQVDQRHRRGRPRRDRPRRPRHHPRPAERDRRARHRAGARRQRRVRRPDRRREPRSSPGGRPAATRPASRRPSPRCSSSSRSSPSARASPPPTSAAASSRCSRSGMAFVSRPRVLLIDELSLGLAPVIVGQLLPIVQRLAADGVAVVLVEQSVNVALTVAERAYFMERGDDPLQRPDGRPARPPRPAAVGVPPAGERGGDADRRSRVAAAPSGGRRRRGRWRSPSTGSSDGFGGIRAVDGATFDVHEREIVGIIGPNGAGKTTIFDLVSGFLPLDAGRIVLAGHDVTHAVARRAVPQAGLGRSFQDALLFPDMTVSETLEVALERWVGTPQRARRGAAAADGSSTTRTARARAGRRAARADGPRAVPHQLRPRAVDRHAPHRRPRLPGRPPADRDPARRAVVGHRPARGRSAGAGAASGCATRWAPRSSSSSTTSRSSPTISDRLIALDMGRVIATGSPADVIVHPQVVESYLGTSSAAISRSGTRG